MREVSADRYLFATMAEARSDVIPHYRTKVFWFVSLDIPGDLYRIYVSCTALTNHVRQIIYDADVTLA